MKRYLKIVSVLLSVILLSASLCGCNQLDDLRSRTGEYTSASNIKLGGNIYKKLPIFEEPMFSFNYEADNIFVADEDVPLLLRTSLGDEYYISDDKVILQQSYGENTVYYCRSDRYEELENQILKGFEIEKYRYEYWVYDEDSFYDAEYYYLTDKQMKVIDQVLANEPEKLAEDMNILSDYIISVQACSKNEYFVKQSCEINIYKGNYTLAVYDESQTYIYRVPETLNKDFEEITRVFVDSEEEYMQTWE